MSDPGDTAFWTSAPELNFASVTLRDADQGVLHLMRSYTFDEQDAQLGMDTYCLTDDTATYYGGLLGYTLGKNAVTLRLSAEAADTLGLAQEVRFAVGRDGVAVCRDRFPDLLHGLGDPVVHADRPQPEPWS